MTARCARKHWRRDASVATHGLRRIVPTSVHEALGTPGEALDRNTRADMEAAFGCDFSAVRVHRDGVAARSAADVEAMAYSVGSQIVLGPEAGGLSTPFGRKVLAHELAHVVQDPAPARGAAIEVDWDPGSAGEKSAHAAAAGYAAGRKVSVGAAPGFTPRLHRLPADRPAGGCGWCSPPASAGTTAHSAVEAMFYQVYPSVKPEVTIFNPADKENGRLDLMRVTQDREFLQIEIGEIKPDNSQGRRDGFEDLRTYEGLIRSAAAEFGKGGGAGQVLLSRLTLEPPSLPIRFPQRESAACPEQALMVRSVGNGLYAYSCTPPRASAVPDPCCGEPVKVRVPETSEEQKRQPQTAPATAWSMPSAAEVERVLKILGLSALLVAAVSAALADPEPGTKLALAVGSVVLASAILKMLKHPSAEA